MTQSAQVESAHLAAIFEQMTDALVARDLDGIVTAWNANATRLFGYTADEMIGQSVLRLIPEDRVDEASVVTERATRGESVPDYDTVRLKKGGEPIEVTIAAAPIKDECGRIVAVVNTVRDASSRHRTEETFRVVVEAAPNALIVVNHEGRIVLVNSQTERLFGFHRQELIGKRPELLIPERFRRGHESAREHFLERPQVRAMGSGKEFCGLRKDGTEVPIEIGLNPVQTPAGTMVLTSIINITERKRAERASEQQREELKRSNRDLEQFAYVASHDLQEPLRAVAGCVQVLQKRYSGNLDERADEYIRHAVEGCHRMQTLIEDLLTFSRIGRMTGKRGAVDCESSLVTALENLSVSIQESGAQITWDPLPSIVGESSHLVMLFQNLLGNAIKFRKPGEVPHIHIHVIREEDRITLTVKDNGIGIPSEQFERIFGVFQRLHTRTEYPGTGIGLAVCKRIVEYLGGSIWVESKPGEGTAFHFAIPTIQRSHDDTDEWQSGGDTAGRG